MSVATMRRKRVQQRRSPSGTKHSTRAQGSVKPSRRLPNKQLGSTVSNTRWTYAPSDYSDLQPAPVAAAAAAVPVDGRRILPVVATHGFLR
jgi:hypothetical protein